MNMKAHDVFGPRGLWESPQQGDLILLEFGQDVICMETEVSEITWQGHIVIEGDDKLFEVLETCGLVEVELPSTKPDYQVALGPEQELLTKERGQALKAAMAAFPPRNRDIMLMHLQGNTLADISKKHSVSKEAIRRIIAKATSILKYEMYKRGVSDEKRPHRVGFQHNASSNVGLAEAEYQGRKVNLGKPFLTPDGPKKRSVYVKNPKSGNVIKVNFGDKKMRIKKSKNGVKRERRLLKERTFKIEAKRYPLDSENIKVLKSLRG